MKMVYQWKINFFKCDPQVAGEYIDALKQTIPNLTTQTIVDDAVANPDTCPYHDFFEWDDGVAANKHRCHQAGQIVQNLTVTVQHSEQEEVSAPIRAYVSLGEGRTEGNKMGYGAEHLESIVEVMSDEDKRRMLMSKALGELNSWRLRYQALAEFAKLFTFIDALTAKLGDKIGYVQHTDRAEDGELQEVRGDD